MTNAKKLPKPIRISRKLTLSSERLVVMADAGPSENAVACTHRATGCPIHTC
jgi:hypothetical protein